MLSSLNALSRRPPRPRYWAVQLPLDERRSIRAGILQGDRLRFDFTLIELCVILGRLIRRLRNLMRMPLRRKTVLMTGAGRGMGRSMAVGLAEAGAKVAMIDIDGDVLAEAAAEAEAAGGQGSVQPFVCDVTNADRANTTVEEVIGAFGAIDMLVNDAVVGPERIPDFFVKPSKFWELDDDLWNAMLRVNIFGPQLMAKTCALHMIG
ncbi:MAG: SDR family oxidoreductase, partial [Rickettsiales bacterium]